MKRAEFAATLAACKGYVRGDPSSGHGNQRSRICCQPHVHFGPGNLLDRALYRHESQRSLRSNRAPVRERAALELEREHGCNRSLILRAACRDRPVHGRPGGDDLVMQSQACRH